MIIEENNNVCDMNNNLNKFRNGLDRVFDNMYKEIKCLCGNIIRYPVFASSYDKKVLHGLIEYLETFIY